MPSLDEATSVGDLVLAVRVSSAERLRYAGW